MSYRKVPEVGDETKSGILEDLELALRRKQRADEVLAGQLRDALTHAFTVRELADALGMAPATLSRWSKSAPSA